MGDNKVILPILKTALKIEADGANFYSMAAGSTDNTSAKEIFTFLAEEEKKHYEFFLKSLEALEDGDKLNYSEALRSAQTLKDETKEVFNRDFLKRLKGDNFSLSAVSIGIKLENNSIDFYKKLKSEQDNEEAGIFYDFLIDTEISHHDLLARMEKEMMEESWSRNRFSPF